MHVKRFPTACFLVIFALVVGVFAVPQSAQANLLQNGYFSAGQNGNPGTQGEGYTLSDPGQDYFYCCFAVHIGLGSISQTFATVTNEIYNLTGYIISGTYSLTAGNLSVGPTSTDGPISYQFTASGNSTTLTVSAASGSSVDINYLDVEDSMTSAPAPTVGGGAASMLACASIMAWSALRRRSARQPSV
jgi:hypothetical protein